ncbi:hypothetical protein [Bacilliculturomica massiliensis]|uniref:hypothetical protein n=1 Tax=Bacilliculturomica massiliensis TaxID=1917867 RepID=UPI0010313DD8|nr:hypothetical protein [Bacilliculturomica massiliensis]
MNDNYKFQSKKITNVIFYSLIMLGVLLTVVRWISAFDSRIVVINEEINSHISNLSLSLISYLAIGFTWILQGMKFKKIVMLGIVIIIANLLCETVMGFMNTPDIIDAVYGVVGTIIGFCFLALAERYGLDTVQKTD